MSQIKTFQELQVWQKAHETVLEVYQITRQYLHHELFGLVSQTRRAAVSVPANIVEGFRRHSLKEALHFYTISDGSLEELKYHLLLARDLLYLSKDQYFSVLSFCEETGRLLSRWIQSQRQFT